MLRIELRHRPKRVDGGAPIVFLKCYQPNEKVRLLSLGKGFEYLVAMRRGATRLSRAKRPKALR